jgi:D-galactarolactone cycloisomerase
MKISQIETFRLKVPLGDRRFWSSQCPFGARKGLLVRLETEGGLVGWGEAGQYGPGEAVVTAIHSVLAPRLIGQDPRQIEVLWERMYTTVRDFGRAGVYVEGISGIDIALWDLLGKHLNVPVYMLLGGAFRKQVALYATGLYYSGEEPELASNLPQVQAEAEDYVARGFSAVKLKIGLFTPDEDLERVALVRRILGNRILLVDANHAYAPHVAARVAKGLERHDVFWFEEPVVPEDLAGYLHVKSKTSIAIAGGECEHTRFGFERWFAARALDIAQPDICCAGGLTELKRIAAMASAFHVSCFPHVWGSALALSAGLHFLAALPPAPMTARPAAPFNEPLLEWDSSPNPLRTAIFRNPPEMEAGAARVPEGPGIGIEPDMVAARPYLASHIVTDAHGTREIYAPTGA